MSRTYKLDLEQRSAFLTPVEALGEEGKAVQRDDTSPLRNARLIGIERIQPDPSQPHGKPTSPGTHPVNPIGVARKIRIEQ